MTRQTIPKMALCGVLVLLITSGCLATPGLDTEYQDENETTTDTPTTQTCLPVIQTERISSDEINRSGDAVTAYEELSPIQQELFRRAYSHGSYEVKNVSTVKVMELANDVIQYENATYRVNVIIC